jgi:drug/metabolite transporter (DMT)-like permease
LKRKYIIYTLWAVVACLLWSTAFAGIKIGLQYTTPVRFAGFRFFLAGLMIMPFAGTGKNYLHEIKTHWRYVVKVSFFQTFVLYSLFYLGMNKVPGAIGAIIVGGGPLIIAVMAHIFIVDDKISMKKLIAILLGITGIVFIALDRLMAGAEQRIEFWGIVLLVVANISGSFGNVIVSKNKGKVSPFVLSSAQLSLGGLALFILSLGIEGADFRTKPVPYYVALLWLSFLSAAAFSIWFSLLKKPDVKVSEINIWKFIIPVLGAIWSWLLIEEESPELPQLIGMSAIALSIILINWRTKRVNMSPVPKKNQTR